MTQLTIQKALDAVVAAHIGTTSVAWDGVVFVPVMGTPYVASHMASITRIRLGNGPKGVIQWSGVYQLSWNASSGDRGLGPALAGADTLSGFWKAGDTYITTDGIIITVDAANVAPPVVSDKWISVPVRIPWDAFEFPT